MVETGHVAGDVLVQDKLLGIGPSREEKPDRGKGQRQETAGKEGEKRASQPSCRQAVKKQHGDGYDETGGPFRQNGKGARQQCERQQPLPLLFYKEVSQEDSHADEKGEGHIHDRFPGISKKLVVGSQNQGPEKTRHLVVQPPAQEIGEKEKQGGGDGRRQPR